MQVKIIKIINSLKRSPVITTGFATLVKFGAGVIVLPLVVVKWSDIDVSVWLLFRTIIGIANLVDFGFGPTIVRATSYFFSGQQELPEQEGANFNKWEESQATSNSPNVNGIVTLCSTISRMYIWLGLGASGLTLIVGTLSLWHLFSLAGHSIYLWGALGIYVINGFVVVQVTRWSSILLGLDCVALLQSFVSVIELIRIILYSLVILSGGLLFTIAFIDVLLNIFLLIYSRAAVKKWLQNKNASPVIDKDSRIIRRIWPATWRFGGMIWGSYFIRNSTSLIVAQIPDQTMIAGFLLTARLLELVRQVSGTPIIANLPRIYQMVANNQFQKLRKFVSERMFISLTFLSASMILIGLFGDKILIWMGTEKKLVPLNIYIIMSIAILLELHHGLHANIYMATNNVPFLLPGLISGLCIFLLSKFYIDPYGVIALVVIQFAVQAAFNNWYSVYLSLRLCKWDFSEYLRDMFVLGSKFVFSLGKKYTNIFKTEHF